MKAPSTILWTNQSIITQMPRISALILFEQSGAEYLSTDFMHRGHHWKRYRTTFVSAIFRQFDSCSGFFYIAYSGRNQIKSV